MLGRPTSDLLTALSTTELMAAMPLEAGERPAACPLVLSGVSSACGARLWAVPPA